ncbi:hypothetical protein PRZ48_005481 [Zasmidium cellare]|uniref:Uncharacterized protein n=1 Tax=Zasmidium cellare TaxID=395010 RepID=A0ABR0ETI9_ZASCE|nr:hypothetical protein PRZ48_005481 [Zasmidium cellare]
MKFTSAFLLAAAAALTSATAIDMDPAAPAKQDNLRIQFSHDYDCKWRHHGKGQSHQSPENTNNPLLRNPDLPKCGSSDYKGISFKFDKKDEAGKCFSPKDLKFDKDQHDFHSFSFCMPKRLEKQGCKFYIHDDVHCEGVPLHVIDTKDKDGLKPGQCLNVDDGRYEVEHLNDGGARSIRVECPSRPKITICDPKDLEEADQWTGMN